MHEMENIGIVKISISYGKETMKKKVKTYIETHKLWQKDDAVLVALSGGADSVCLLSILKELSEEAKESAFRLRAVHVHHGIRGAEADRDEAFVRVLCKRMDVPLFVTHCQVPAYAKEHGISEEEAGRLLRYEIFEKEAEHWESELPADCQVKIALAHHQDDNVETILHHLVRGSGLTGLAGIRPIQGRRVRPLLCVGRSEIRAYLNEQGAVWCEDSTNLSLDYTRNRIRNQVVPLLKSAVNEQAGEHILQAGEIIGQADDYLVGQADKIWAEAGRLQEKEQKQAEIRLDVFSQQPDIIKSYLIRRMLDEVTPGWKDITYRHFTQIIALAKKQVGSRMDLPGTLEARTSYEMLVIGAKQTEEDSKDRGEKRELCGEGEMSSEMEMSVFPYQKDQKIPKNQYTKWFDYDKIKGTLSVRTRRTGDYLILPSGGRKTIARLMIDEKIPKEEREKILLLADGNHILWVVGYRISEYYKVEEQTENILQVTCDGGKDYGR